MNGVVDDLVVVLGAFRGQMLLELFGELATMRMIYQKETKLAFYNGELPICFLSFL